jgi:cobalt transporter subunit CbtA
MKLFQRIFFAAVLSGLAAGIAMAAIQQWQVVPLILEAELFETAAPAAAEHAHEPGTPGHEHDTEAWAPQDGAERTFYTALSGILGATGFALLLAAASVLSGIEITARNGVVWGLGGFAAFQLAPAFGLAPELPGMAAADLGTRQIWWSATALATGAAALGIARFRNWTAVGIGAVLILLPHIIGAPAAPDEPTAVPAHLAAEFAARTLGAGAVFWLSVGPLLGWLNERFARVPVAVAKGAHA